MKIDKKEAPAAADPAFACQNGDGKGQGGCVVVNAMEGRVTITRGTLEREVQHAPPEVGKPTPSRKVQP